MIKCPYMYRKDKKDEYYTRKAKQEGYPARSVYKLKEIDEKYKIFKKGDLVLDLGCAPGSWLKYISEKIGENGKVIGVDLNEKKIPLAKNIIFIQKDIFQLGKDDFIKKFNAVVSDLSPKTSGIKFADETASLDLAEKAFELAKMFLKAGGNFICKIFEGGLADNFFKEVKKEFRSAKLFRPKAVIKGSREIYIIGKDFLYK